MPKGSLTEALVEFVRKPRAAVVATTRPDGAPATAATWYDWDDGRLLFSMSPDGRRLRDLRSDPRLALTVLATDWHHQVSIRATAVVFRDDPKLVVVDRLSQRYTGAPYPKRDIRSTTVLAQVDSWHTWGEPESAA